MKLTEALAEDRHSGTGAAVHACRSSGIVAFSPLLLARCRCHSALWNQSEAISTSATAPRSLTQASKPTERRPDHCQKSPAAETITGRRRTSDICEISSSYRRDIFLISERCPLSASVFWPVHRSVIQPASLLCLKFILNCACRLNPDLMSMAGRICCVRGLVRGATKPV